MIGTRSDQSKRPHRTANPEGPFNRNVFKTYSIMVTNSRHSVKSSRPEVAVAVLSGERELLDNNAPIEASGDSEYVPIVDAPTNPTTYQIALDEHKTFIYQHPRSRVKSPHLREFVTGLAVVDALKDKYDCDWRRLEEPPKKGKVKIIDLHIFSAIKDIEFPFADVEDYKTYVLPFIQRKRRISLKPGLKYLRTPWQVCYGDVDSKGNLIWLTVCLKITDISAMQGIATFLTYATNVGIKMLVKEIIKKEDKGRMDEVLMETPEVFITYATDDVSGNKVVKIKYFTIDFYNQIATVLDIPHRKNWGMSTGKIVASLVTSWMALTQPQVYDGLVKACDYYNRKGVPVTLPDGSTDDEGSDRWTPEKLFYRALILAGSEGISQAAKLDRNKKLGTYGAMVDGGRAVFSATEVYARCGIFADLDIKSAYGNGLKNQLFGVGNPTIIAEQMSFRDAYQIVKKECVPGLWELRVSWKDAPFKQALLVSKKHEKFTLWESGVNYDEETDNFIFVVDDKGEVPTKIFDASMVLLENSVEEALVNHDSLQVLLPRERGGRSSNIEWTWILDNAVVTSMKYFARKDEVKVATVAMFAPTIFLKATRSDGGYCKQWVRIDLDKLMKPLLAERAKHPKGGEMNMFLKLIINTIYGCMASAFFSDEGTGISNMIVANNITARTRVLAYLMEVDLGTRMSVTDGGVFDINKVVHWKRHSLHNDAMLAHGGMKYENRHRPYEYKPLIEGITTEMVQSMDNEQFKAFLAQINKAAWEHIKAANPKLDITAKDQFSFETKQICQEIAHHAKVDYCLFKVTYFDETLNTVLCKPRTAAMRGVPKTEEERDKAIDAIFEAIREDRPGYYAHTGTRQLTLTEFNKYENNQYKIAGLLPGDTITKYQEWFSHPPLGYRFRDMAHRDRIIDAYIAAKDAVERDENGKVVMVEDPFKAKYPLFFPGKERLVPKKLPIEVRAQMVYDLWKRIDEI